MSELSDSFDICRYETGLCNVAMVIQCIQLNETYSRKEESKDELYGRALLEENWFVSVNKSC